MAAKCCDNDETFVEPIDVSRVLAEPLPLVTERYFKKYYSVDVKGRKGEDQCVLQHSNKLCMVCLAPSHPLCNEDNITEVDFRISSTIDRLQNNPSGKFKSGQKLTPSSPLCFVHCGEDKKYCLYSCIKGFLVEVNENLITNPSLLRTNPIGEGYIALILPRFKDGTNVCDSLLSEEEYRTHRIEERAASLLQVSEDNSEDTDSLDT